MMNRSTLKKLYLLLANEKNLQREMLKRRIKNLRMVSITQSYNLMDNPVYQKARRMINVLEREDYERIQAKIEANEKERKRQ